MRNTGTCQTCMSPKPVCNPLFPEDVSGELKVMLDK